jgi:amidohydrolase
MYMLTELNERLEELFPEMVELRRHFHRYPELSFQEEATPVAIGEYLMNLGIEVKTGVGGRGVIGIIRGGKPGKTVALRADFDALPIQDEKDVPYKSQVPGVMHACGHDAHTAALLGAAKALNEQKDQLHGTVVLIHQFAEEIAPGGAIAMIEDGCLDGVDAIFGTHLWSSIPVGQIRYRSGAIMAAADKFTITINGKGGHGAAPHETVDSIAIGMTLINSLQQIVSRRVDPLKPAVLTVSSFHAGDAFNVIADSAQMIGTVRTFERELQDLIIENMEKLTTSVAEGAGGKASLNYEKGYPAVVNHQKETTLLQDIAVNLLGEDQVIEMTPVMGGEDFSYYLQKVPGTFFFTGVGNPEKGADYPHHHPKFDLDEKGMLIAAQALAGAACQYLQTEAAAEQGVVI